MPILATAIPGVTEIMGEEEALLDVVVPIADVTTAERLLGLTREWAFRAKKRAQDFSSVCWRAIAGFPAGAGGGVTEGRIKL
jgi:hypothetical protein